MAEQTAAILARAADLTAAGDPDAAVRLLRGLLATDGDNAEVWCRLAAAQLEADAPDDALDSAGRALRLPGETGWAQRLISLALAELGRRGEAISAGREAVRAEPDNWRAHIALADCLAAHDGSLPEAAEAARTAVELAPDHSRPHEVLGQTAERLSDRTTAERAYRAVLRRDPRSEVALAGLRRLASARPELPPAVPVTTRHAFAKLLRRLAVWLAAGSLLLILAGMPEPARLLAWFGLALLVACLAATGAALRTFPPASRWRPRRWWQGSPVLALGGLAIAGAVLLVASWTLVLALDVAATRLLTFALCCATVAGMLGVLGSPHRTRRRRT
ncbi:MAG: tetratricopeptide repeat protein [Pseudonocardiaceae bacterium]|nr:tetratricopeptide repeat protein [Pseudonocardiaceae bacterium]